jgi:hypothetical protein
MNDEELDALLRLDAAAGPVDAGFTERLLARLPPRRAVRTSSRLPWRMVQLAASSIALFGFCLLWPGVAEAWMQAQSGSEPALGGAVLLALAVWWTLPQARGNPWR